LPAVFLGAFFFGESVIITASLLGPKLGLSFIQVYVFALSGTIMADLCWFWFGDLLSEKSQFLKRKNKIARKKYANLVEKIIKERSFLALLYIKFLYGTRVLTIMYLSLKKIPVRKFLLFDLLGTIIWLFTIMGLSWGVSLGIRAVTNEVRYIGYLLLLAVAIIIIFYLISQWIKKKLSRG
jgi:membrane protein DedA with SNARE-associated domain